MDFETELLKLTEAYCVHNALPIRRRFSDQEIESSLLRVQQAIRDQQPLDLPRDPENYDYDPDYARMDDAARRGEA